MPQQKHLFCDLGIGDISRETRNLVLQPDAQPILQGLLYIEIDGTYANLSLVECTGVDKKQAKFVQIECEQPSQPSHEQWQAIPAFQRLASKHTILARMWHHEIHSFQEFARHRLSISWFHPLAFISLVYSMMAPLYETVPAFEATWDKCLGVLDQHIRVISHILQHNKASITTASIFYRLQRVEAHPVGSPPGDTPSGLVNFFHNLWEKSNEAAGPLILDLGLAIILPKSFARCTAVYTTSGGS